MSVHSKNRKTGTYWYCVYRDKGKQIWEPFGKGNEAKKRALERNIEVAYLQSHGRNLEKSKLEAISFSDMVEVYLSRRTDLSNRTVNEICYAMSKWFLPRVGSIDISALTSDDAINIEKDMTSKGLSARSVNKYFQYANHIIDFSVWAFHLHENPWKKRIPLKPAKFHIELLTIDEYALIYHNSQEHLKWALEVEYYTGMRPGATELFAALWEHVDWNNSRIRIYASKTDDWRWQYLPAHFMDRMRHQYANRTCEYIVTYHGKPVTSQLTKL